MATTDKLNCKSLVELVTDYLEQVLPSDLRKEVDGHLQDCPACRTYVEQMRVTIRATGKLAEEQIPSDVKQSLLQLFRRQGAVREVRLGFAGQCACPGDHIGYFWETEEDFEEGVRFLEVGLDGTDACFVFGHEDANRRVLESLGRHGYDAKKLEAAGRLHVLVGDASADQMMADIGGRFQKALAGGAPLLRLLGNLGWGRNGWPTDDDILAFEAKVTDAARQFPCVSVCMYDVHALSGRVLLKGGFQTHPLVARSHLMYENPLYVPSETFLSALRGEHRSTRVQ